LKKAVLLIAIAFVYSILGASVSFAADFPSRKIDIIVPFGPGSGTDTTMRALAPSLQKVLGVPVVVQNIEGSSGLRGLEYASKQPADGYTLFLNNTTHILLEMQNLSPIALTQSFDPVACVVQDSVLFTASANGRFKTWKDVVAYAKENPGKVTVSGSSPRGVDGVSTLMVAKGAGIEVTFIPFNSGAEAMSAILGGHVDLGNMGPADAMEMIRGGEMNGILVTSEKRLDIFPDTPTTYDEGINVTAGAWRALAVPKGTPPEVISKLESAIREAYDSPEFQKWLKDVTLDQRPGWKDAKGLGELWQSELIYFKKAFEEIGL
jgi:tripartite-type tricarboxylate transporter receptor subunit TctC